MQTMFIFLEFFLPFSATAIDLLVDVGEIRDLEVILSLVRRTEIDKTSL